MLQVVPQSDKEGSLGAVLKAGIVHFPQPGMPDFILPMYAQIWSRGPQGHGGIEKHSTSVTSNSAPCILLNNIFGEEPIKNISELQHMMHAGALQLHARVLSLDGTDNWVEDVEQWWDEDGNVIAVEVEEEAGPGQDGQEGEPEEHDPLDSEDEGDVEDTEGGEEANTGDSDSDDGSGGGSGNDSHGGEELEEGAVSSVGVEGLESRCRCR